MLVGIVCLGWKSSSRCNELFLKLLANVHKSILLKWRLRDDIMAPFRINVINGRGKSMGTTRRVGRKKGAAGDVARGGEEVNTITITVEIMLWELLHLQIIQLVSRQV